MDRLIHWLLEINVWCLMYPEAASLLATVLILLVAGVFFGLDTISAHRYARRRDHAHAVALQHGSEDDARQILTSL